MLEKFTEKAMTGMYVLGQAMSPKGEEAANAMAMIIVGHYDLELKCMAYFKENGTHAASEVDLEQPAVLAAVNKVKDFIRGMVQDILNEGARQDELQAKQHKAEVIAKIAEAERPHELGTVAQIAEKYGISKSEVRRMKAAGTLHTLKERV